MRPPSSISPSICPTSPSSSPPSLLLSAISAAAIAAKFYRVSHLNRQNISPGIQPQWAACLPPIAPSRRAAISGWKITNRWGGWRTKRHRQISICYTNTPFSSSTKGLQKALDLDCCLAKKNKNPNLKETSTLHCPNGALQCVCLCVCVCGWVLPVFNCCFSNHTWVCTVLATVAMGAFPGFLIS